mgnify:CR=1 FL=1
MKIGCHVSIQDGIENCFSRAAQLNCETLQIFTQNQRQWIAREYTEPTIAAFQRSRSTEGFAGVPILAHASYLINLCAPDEEKLQRSRLAFLQELHRCDRLGIDYLIIHPGAHGGKGMSWGITKIAETLNWALKQYRPAVKILLETIAGQGTGVGSRFEELRQIMDAVNESGHLGVCLDTCHIFAAGYSIKNDKEWEKVLRSLERNLGLQRVRAIHLNDSLYECGSRKDRHAAIGHGQIGLQSFRFLMNFSAFAGTAGVLEVPGGDVAFQQGIALLKSLRV